jgi:hypothetical protein
MKTYLSRRIPVVVAASLALAMLAVGFLAALGVRSLVAGTASASPAAPNPGHEWSQVEGHGIDGSTYWLGTTADQALELKVNGQRALRLEPTSFNVIGGYSGNSVTAGAGSATIGGGGASDFGANRVTDHCGTVSGGVNNQAGNGGAVDDQACATVSGGFSNFASGGNATDGGGHDNTASGGDATVGGGYSNDALGYHATVGGGLWNTGSADSATIGGGNSNRVTDDLGTVGGGYNNQAGDNAGTPSDRAGAAVGGGNSNTASGEIAFVGGGNSNTASAPTAFVGGGSHNTASGNSASVAGGAENNASGDAATVAGGYLNSASFIATVGGGSHNTASGSLATIGGGQDNLASGQWSTVSGGNANVIGGDFATVGGGQHNSVSGPHATVPGGDNNSASGLYSFAAGQRAKANHAGSFVWADSNDFDFASLTNNHFAARATGGAAFVTAIDGTGAPTSGVFLSSGDNAWAAISDRSVKANFSPVDGRDVLGRLASVPVETWNLKSQDASIRHMGPMAQDFYAAFGLGTDERYISTVDADGVALAAIQGLYELVQEKDVEIADLKERVEELEREGSVSVPSSPSSSSGVPAAWLVLGGAVLVALVLGQRMLAARRKRSA